MGIGEVSTVFLLTLKVHGQGGLPGALLQTCVCVWPLYLPWTGHAHCGAEAIWLWQAKRF